MTYLILSVVSSVMIAVVIHVNEGRNLDRCAVMLFNYFAASALALAIVDRRELLAPMGRLAPLASFSAFCFVTAFLVYMIAVRRLGLAIPVTVTRLSVVIPVLGSLLIYSEDLNSWQDGGLVLAIVAIILFSGARPGDAARCRLQNPPRSRSPAIFPALCLFFLMGCGDFSLKMFHENFDPALTTNFILMVFGISSIYTLVLVIVRRSSIDRGTIAAGIILGIPNFLAAYFILKVLHVFPGAIAFPLNDVGIIVLSTLTGFLVWKEHLRKIDGIAMLVSIVAVVLLNMAA